MFLRSQARALRQQREQPAVPESANAPSVQQDTPTMDEGIVSATNNDKTGRSKFKTGHEMSLSDDSSAIPTGPVQPITGSAGAANITPCRRASRISADLSITTLHDTRPAKLSSPSKRFKENDNPDQSELTPRRRSLRIAQALQDNNGRTVDNVEKDDSTTVPVFNEAEHAPQPSHTRHHRSQRNVHALQDSNGRAYHVNKSASTSAELLPKDSESVVPDVNLEAPRARPAPVQIPSRVNVEEDDIRPVWRSHARLPSTTARNENSDPLLATMMQFLLGRPPMDSGKGTFQPASSAPANLSPVVQLQPHIERGDFHPVTIPEEVTNATDLDLPSSSNSGNLFGLGYGYGYHFPQGDEESFFEAEFAAYQYAHAGDIEDSETYHLDAPSAIHPLPPLRNESPVETGAKANVDSWKKEKSVNDFVASIINLSEFED
ncbi:hypothetical protein PMG11_10807 [Penicillium brasilianum]|uniref:Uncharacterized protein n=1 Tax=Penicillium brasilianum TaxID=104259 RepID=A0A0F7U3M1_PENBI|nr:hypothetical protein PMG11_10807 [Penicillium brasilianum]